MSRSSGFKGLALAVIVFSSTANADYPVFSGGALESGRAVWLENCEGCHAYGIAGAPLAGDAEIWSPRIAKGIPALYENAIEGFFGPRGTMMPARGGNEALSDEQVRAAVDYMVMLAGPPADTEN